MSDEPQTVEGEDGQLLRNSVMQGPVRNRILSSDEYRRFNIRHLVKSYISEADEAVGDDDFVSFGELKISCGEEWKEVDALYFGRKWATRNVRGTHYNAAEYQSEVHSLAGSEREQREHRDVSYGRVLIFLEYQFSLNEQPVTRSLMLTEWPSKC